MYEQTVTIDKSVNVFDEPLETCGDNPLTGFFRDGCCNTNDQDKGSHTVCINASKEFLEYSKSAGNDLSTPQLEFGFSGVSPGDNWCLCAARWLQAYEDGVAPRVYLKRTHKRALEIIPIQILKRYALDLI